MGGTSSRVVLWAGLGLAAAAPAGAQTTDPVFAGLAVLTGHGRLALGRDGRRVRGGRGRRARGRDEPGGPDAGPHERGQLLDRPSLAGRGDRTTALPCRGVRHQGGAGARGTARRTRADRAAAVDHRVRRGGGPADLPARAPRRGGRAQPAERGGGGAERGERRAARAPAGRWRGCPGPLHARGADRPPARDRQIHLAAALRLRAPARDGLDRAADGRRHRRHPPADRHLVRPRLARRQPLELLGAGRTSSASATSWRRCAATWATRPPRASTCRTRWSRASAASTRRRSPAAAAASRCGPGCTTSRRARCATRATTPTLAAAFTSQRRAVVFTLGGSLFAEHFGNALPLRSRRAGRARRSRPFLRRGVEVLR